VSTRPITVGVLGFDRVNALDITGPLEVFTAVTVEGRPAYQSHVVSVTGQPFTAESGVAFMPTAQPPDSFDTILIPGGEGLREPNTLAEATSWIRRHAPAARRVVSICTGAFGLCATGLMDGRQVTTHWRFADLLAAQNASVAVRPEALFIKDDQFYTSAGITAGLDLALLLVEEDFGPSAAAAAAKELVMFLRRPGNQAQICDALEVQARSADRLSDLVAWMAANLRHDQTVVELSRRVGMSPRHFARRFQERYGTTPGKFRENLRLDQARARLETDQTLNLGSLAAQLGFSGEDTFSRAFKRRFGVRPSDHRRAMRSILEGESR